MIIQDIGVIYFLMNRFIIKALISQDIKKGQKALNFIPKDNFCLVNSKFDSVTT